MRCAVDSRRQGMRSTGIVNEARDWVQSGDGRRTQSEEQSRHEDTGMPLWEVEVLFRQTSYGRESNTTATVRVGSPVRPTLGEFAPVEFSGLVVEVRVNKAGQVSEFWSAEELAGATGGSSGSRSADSSGSAEKRRDVGTGHELGQRAGRVGGVLSAGPAGRG